MFEWIAKSVIGGLAGPLLDGYKAKLAAGTSHDTLAQGLALRELELQVKETEVQGQMKIAMIGHWYEPEKIAEYVCVSYLTKIVVWDVMLDLGTTDPIKGAVGVWIGMIFTFMFGKRGVENAIQLWKAK